MGFDVISNSHVCAFAKSSSKNKRVAKLRKNKLVDCERQHYHIQETNSISTVNWPPVPKGIQRRQRQENLLSIVRREGDSCRNSRRKFSSSPTSCSTSSSCSEEDRDKVCLNDWETDIRSRPPSCAWAPDDVFRPQSLPRVSRPPNNVHVSVDGTECHEQQQHSVCPICCEDLDVTDSRFLPCSCGFRLCLFCHKKIVEVDARCPGCRKRYGSENFGLQRVGL